MTIGNDSWKDYKRTSPVVQWVKGLVFSLQQLRFDPWLWELPHAAGAVGKKKKKMSSLVILEPS